MDAIVEFIQGRLFWRILLFLHFSMAVTLLVAVTLQAISVLMPARQLAIGNFIERVGTYDPRRTEIRVHGARVRHWLDRGALPTHTVALLLKRKDVVDLSALGAVAVGK